MCYAWKSLIGEGECMSFEWVYVIPLLGLIIAITGMLLFFLKGRKWKYVAVTAFGVMVVFLFLLFMVFFMVSFIQALKGAR